MEKIQEGKTMSKDDKTGWTATYHRNWTCTQLTPPTVPFGNSQFEEEKKIAEETFRKMISAKSEKNVSE